MNINFNQVTSINVKQEPTKKNRNVASSNKENEFSYSMENSLNENKSLTSKEDNENNKDKIPGENKEDKKKNLESLLYFVNFISSDNVDYEENIFDFNKDLLDSSMDISSEGIGDVLKAVGMSKEKIENGIIPKGDILEHISTNNIKFKDVIGNLNLNNNVSVDKINLDIPTTEMININFEVNGELNNSLEIDGEVENTEFENESLENILDSRELLNNIKNHLTKEVNKINKSDNSETSDLNNNINNENKMNIKPINSQEILNIKTKNQSPENILKEISGESDLKNNFMMQFVNNIRTVDAKEFQEIYSKNLNTNTKIDFVKDFIDSVQYMKDNNKSEMIVKLNPEQLGKMDIKYETVKDSVRLMITVENKEALKIMTNVIVDIKNMIKENHQINLENIQVDLNQFGFDSNEGNNNKGEGNSKKGNNTIKIEDEEKNSESKDLRSGILV